MEFLGFTLDVATLTETALGLVTKLVLALIIFIVGRWIAKKVVNFFTHMMTRSNLDNTVTNFLARLLHGVLLVIVILAALNKVGVETTSVVAILGGAALAVGLALQNQLSNFAAGVMIIVFRPFVSGDFVEINGLSGTVTDITLINTHITTLNNHDIIIPNSDISSNSITNYTSLPTRRVDITVGIGYGSNLKLAKQVMTDVAKKHPLALKDPEPTIQVTNLGDNSVDLSLHVWTANDDWLKVQCDLLEAFKLAMDEHNIEIPFPQRSIHITGMEQLIENKTVS